MINKIIASYVFFSCLIAIALYLAGVDGTVHFGQYFRAYIVQTNKDLLDFKIAIPNIPDIPQLPPNYDIDNKTWLVVLNVLIELVNRLSTFINFITRFLNVIISLLNTIIQVVEMIFIFLKNLITMKDTIVQNA